VLQADSAQTTGVAWGTAFPTGVILPYAGATAPTAWLFTDGRTIGNAASGATNRANADTATLFAHLWDNFGNTELPIQDSGGSPSSRGANAATDFAANKRMPLPDLRGRVPVGKDDMGGSAANRITSGGSGIAGTTLGAAGGAETHTLSTSQMPPHSHTFQAGSGWSGSGVDRYNYSGNDMTTSSVGGGAAHQNTQPSLILNYIIKT
jgi:microcystin-dependent protein